MKVMVSLSGGMDSATVLALAVAEGNQVQAVGFSYGSKHNRYENRMAGELATFYQVPFRLIDWSGIAGSFRSNLLLGGGPVPEGYYHDSTMSQTVVPARNLIFCSILAGLAWSEDVGEVWLGIHSGDHFIYPDCRPEFFATMRRAVELGSDGKVTLKAPFLSASKADIVRHGLELGVPFGLTRTCYKDQIVACGRCGACVERQEAFGICGTVDPLEYEGRAK